MAILYLLVLAVPIAAIAGFAIAVAAQSRLTRLEARLVVIERRFGEREAGASPASPPTEPGPQPVAPSVPPAEPAHSEPERIARSAEAPPARPSALPLLRPREFNFEQHFGTRWTVWVGGVAVALGGIFLVRYSIEQGWIGPALRIFFGGLLACGLIGAGEWTRRQDRLSLFIDIPTAHIPSILTAAGTVVAYATVYAAYDLYGFLSIASAFVLLGIVALLTLAAALLHGQALAALGLLGAYLTPIIVAAPVPNYWALYVYLAFVTVAAFALARARLWRWLATTAIALGTLWILPGINGISMDSVVPHAMHAAVGFALVSVFIVPGLALGPQNPSGEIDPFASSALAAFLAAAAVLVFATRHDPAALASFALISAATVGIAWRAEAVTGTVPVSALLVALVLADWAVPAIVDRLVLPGGPAAAVVPQPALARIDLHLTFGAIFGILFGATGFLAQGRARDAIVSITWAATAVLAPIAILMALYYRIAGFERSFPFAAIALLLAALYALATETFRSRGAQPHVAAASAIFASGAVASLALALTLSLERGWLTITFALMAPGIAWVADKRPLPVLRWAAALMASLVLARIIWDPRIVGPDVGTTPIFNWLLYGYGAPAAAFWFGGYVLRRRADDVPAGIIDAAAILFTVLLAFMEIRHWINAGDIYRPDSSLAEVALQVSIGLALAIGLERLRLKTNSRVHDAGALLVAGLTGFTAVIGLFAAQNPLVAAKPVGGTVLNLILLGYGLPALLATVLALSARRTRPQEYRMIAAIFAVGFSISYLSLEVMRLYQGPILRMRAITQAEQYTHSAVWLVFGVLLLIGGIVLRSQAARLASAAVIIITIGKVFLFDLAGLQGVFRALSFLGLGLVLLGIGWLYQRLLFPPRPESPLAGEARA